MSALIRRVWAMPHKHTFTIKPIADLIQRHARGLVIDPFSRNDTRAQMRNDLNPNTSAESHVDARVFLATLAERGIVADTVLLDPPYSPRQITECYAAAGLTAGMKDTQSAVLYAECREQIEHITVAGSIVLSFGWNSTGMGRKWERVETLLVCHGGAHNDTICCVDRKRESLFDAREEGAR